MRHLEQLEQLRWLENEYNIHLDETNIESPSIDTPNDLAELLIKYKDKLK